MAITNLERVGKALLLVRDGLKPNLEKVWQGKYGQDWPAKLNQFDSNPDRQPSPDDLAFLLKGMSNTWQQLFRHQFSHAERSYVSELREARNRWAHNENFTTDQTYRVLDTAELLLQAFASPGQVAEVRGMKQELLRLRYTEEARSEQRKRAEAPTKGEPVAGLAPWRDVIVPHEDVREGRYEQAEFAADLYQVLTGKADAEYQDPAAFFRRTYITEGLRYLLDNTVKRLAGVGGEPVIELQTNFGGGKTHSLIALFHLAGGGKVADLPGVGEVLAEAGTAIPKRVSRAVLVGQMISPADSHSKGDGTEVHTLWGELAWQLGGAEGYKIVAKEDRQAKNPGAKLITLFEQFGPALILIDEWVAYARQLPDGTTDLPAGDFDTQFTFAQALTEAVAAVDNVQLLVSIPSSDVEVGGDRGQDALTRLKNVVSRVAAQWQPATADESFEIVRRRLFETVSPDKARVRDSIVKAFSDFYRDNSGEFPSEAKEGEYRRRMESAYPIHPELFDRLYGDWSTLDRFQRTRGVLRLMAKAIGELWRRGDTSLLIMPGTLPIDSSHVAAELTKYLDEGWDPVIKSDVDGPNSLPLRLDADPRLGRYSAVRRVARAVYMGSAPKDEARRGIDVKRVVLGSAQPGEPPGVFVDGLRRLSGEATYLYVDNAQYWYSLQPNVTRIAQDRAASNYNDDDADQEIRERLLSDRAKGPFGAVHVFPDGPGDVPDDEDAVRLVVLPPRHGHVSNDMTSEAVQAASSILDQRSGGPRLNKNLLVCVAAESSRLAELRTAARLYKAWKSIVEEEEQLNLNPHQVRQAETKLKEADQTVTQRIGETFQLALTPTQHTGSPVVEWHQTRTSGSGSLAERVGKKLQSDETLITAYGGIRVRMDLDRVPLWEDDRIGVRRLWSYYAQYLYLPRLASFEVLASAISDGAAKTTWETDTFGVAEAYDEGTGTFKGLKTGGHVVVDMSKDAVLVKPERAVAQQEGDPAKPPITTTPSPTVGKADPNRFYGRRQLDPVRAIRDLEAIIENITSHLARVDNAEVTIVVEVEATSAGFDDKTRRTVSENANQLGFETHEFED